MAERHPRQRREGGVVEAAIIQATIEELTEVGYARMTIESVARRARAGKMSVYRRWPNRLALAVDAAYAMLEEPDFSDEPSSLRQDLYTWYLGMAKQMDGPIGEAMRGIIAGSLRPEDPTLASLSRGWSVRILETILDRARSRGEEIKRDLTPLQKQVPIVLLEHHYLTERMIDHDYLCCVIDEVAVLIFCA